MVSTRVLSTSSHPHYLRNIDRYTHKQYNSRTSIIIVLKSSCIFRTNMAAGIQLLIESTRNGHYVHYLTLNDQADDCQKSRRTEQNRAASVRLFQHFSKKGFLLPKLILLEILSTLRHVHGYRQKRGVQVLVKWLCHGLRDETSILLCHLAVNCGVSFPLYGKRCERGKGVNCKFVEQPLLA